MQPSHRNILVEKETQHNKRIYCRIKGSIILSMKVVILRSSKIISFLLKNLEDVDLLLLQGFEALIDEIALLFYKT